MSRSSINETSLFSFLEANKLEDGGFQALIDKGFYKTLILNKNSTFRIRSYEVKKNCKDVTIYSLK